MGFKLTWDRGLIRQHIGRMLAEISSPYNDGYTSSAIKKELYEIKCWLDDNYKNLPTFSNEHEWEQDRIVDILKKSK